MFVGLLWYRVYHINIYIYERGRTSGSVRLGNIFFGVSATKCLCDRVLNVASYISFSSTEDDVIKLLQVRSILLQYCSVVELNGRNVVVVAVSCGRKFRRKLCPLGDWGPFNPSVAFCAVM